MKKTKWAFLALAMVGFWPASSWAFTNNSSNSQTGIDQGATRFFVDSGGTMDLADGATVNGLVKVAHANFQYSAANQGLGSSSLGLSIPANSIIMDGMVDVTTGCSTVNGTGSIALGLEAANDIVSTSVVGSGWTKGRHDIVPNGAAANTVKTTVQRGLSIVTATQVLNACKFDVYLRYVVGN